MALILAIGELSGAHLNPAVTIAFAARGDFPWARVPAYLSAQFTGAIVAALFLRALFGPAGDLGVPIPAPAVGAVRTWTLEIVLTAGLVTVILGTASRARNVGGLSAIGIGGYIVLAGLWAGPLGAGSMNPARSLGSALVAGRLDDVWIYLVGPLAGALVAVVLAYILRGPGGDDEARESAQGAAG
jgi:aquaporin Z